MADATDTRIVEMQFKNKDFEKNISVSQKSLEKFKKELNFDEASRGLDNFSKSVKQVDLSTMETNIQKLTDKFTGLGNVGEFVLSRIRKTLEGLGDQVISFANSLTTVQTKAGFVKYESLNKSVQTLRSATGKEEKEIYAVLKRLTDYTDQTSYDFAQGVTSISQLVSSGAASLSKAEVVVEGFYNYAAKAGADTTKAAHALEYSMVQALQRGFLDWGNAKELNRQSLLTMDFKEQLIETAVELGIVTKENGKYYAMSKKGKKEKKVEINATNLFNDSLQHQWATTKVLNATLEKYADTNTEFGEQAYAAAQRCTTFTDALNAWKDMLSTGWMESYRTVFGDLSEAMSLFSAVCEKVSDALEGLVNTRNEILNAWKEMGGRDSLMGALFGEIQDPDENVLFKGAYGILDIITQFGNMVSDGWWNMVMNLIPKDEQQKLLDEVNKNIDLINQQLEKQGQGDLVIQKPFENFAELWNSEFAKGTGLRTGAFGGGLQEATKGLQEFIMKLHEWFNTVDEASGTTRLEKIQSVINAVLNTIAFGFDILGGIIDFVGMIGKQLQPSIDAIGTFFATLAGGVEEGEQSVREGGGIQKFFTSLAEILKPVTGAVNGIVEAVTRLLTALISNEDVAEGAATAWDYFKNALKKVWELVKAIAGPVVTFVTTVINSLAELFENGVTEENVAKFKENAKAAFKVMISGLKAGIKPVYDKIRELLTNLWATVTTAISGYFADENSFGYKAIQWIRNTVQKIKDGLNELFPGATDAIGGFFSNIVTTIREWIDKGELFKGIKESGRQFVQKFTDLFKGGFFEGFKKIGMAIGEVFKGLFVGQMIDEKTGEALGILERLGAMLTKPGSLGEGFLILFRKIKEWWMSLDSETKAFIVTGLVVAYLIKKAFKVVQSIGENFNELAQAIKGNFTSVKKKTFSEKFLMVAAALTLMTASLYVLANLDLWQAVQGLGVLAVILLEIGAFFKWMKGILKDMTVGDSIKLAVGIIGISTAIRRIVDALLPIAEIKDRAQLENMGWALLGITVALSALMAIAKFGKFSWGSGGGMLLFAIAISIMINKLEELLGDPKHARTLEFIKNVFYKLVDLKNAFGLALAGIGIGQMTKNALGMAALAAGVAILIYSLKQVSDLHAIQLIKMGVTLFATLGLLLGFVWAMGKMKNSQGLKDSDMWQLIALAAAVGALIFVLQQINETTKWETLGKMGAVFGGIVVGLIALICAVSLTASKEGRGLKKSGLASAIVLALSIAALILVLQLVADMKWEQLGKMGAVFGVIMVGLISMIVAIGKAAGENSRGFKNAGMITGMVAIVLGIAALIKILSKTADMKVGDLAKMLITYAVIIKGLNSVIRAIGESARQNGSGFKGAGMLLGMFALVRGIGGLIHYMSPLADMALGQISKLWVSMIIIFHGINRCIKVIGKFGVDKNKSIGALISMAALVGAIWAIVEVIKPLSNMSWGGLAKSLIGLVVIVLAIRFVLKSLLKAVNKNYKGADMNEIGSLILLMAGLAVLMIGLSYSLNKVKKIKVRTILAFTIGLSAMMLAIAASAKLMKGVNIKTALITIGTLAVGMAAILGVIGLIGPMVLESIGNSLLPFGEGIKAIGEALKSFGEATTGLSESNVDAAVSALKGIAKVQLALTGENISLAVFSALTGQNIDKGNLQAFADDIVAIAPKLQYIGEQLAGTNFDGFSKAVEALNAMAGIQHTLTKENIDIAFGQWITGQDIERGDLTQFVDDLLNIAPKLQEIGTALAKAKFDKFSQAAKALNAMASVQHTLTKENIDIAFGEWITGKDIKRGDLTQFVDDLLNIAPKLQEIGTALNKAKFDKFSQAASALNAMASVQHTLTKENIDIAFGEWITGKEIEAGDLENFTKKLLTLAPYLEEVGTTLATTNFTAVTKGAEALATFAGVQESLTKQGISVAWTEGLLNFFHITDSEGKSIEVTVESIEDFGEHLRPLGKALADFAGAVSYADLGGKELEPINTEGFKAAVDSLDVLTALQGVLNNAVSGGLFQILTGEGMKLPEFSAGLISLGQGIRGMYEAFFELKDGKAPTDSDFESISRILNGLGSMALSAGVHGDVYAKLSFDSLTSGIRGIISLCDPKNADDVDRMTSLLQSLADVYGTMHLLSSAGDALEDFLENLILDNATQAKLTSAGEELSKKIAEGVEDDASVGLMLKAYQRMASALKSSMALENYLDTLSLNDMLIANLDDVDTAEIEDIIALIDDKVTSAGENENWSFRDIGFYMAAGIAVGVSQGTYLIENACRLAVQKARAAAMDEANAHSPSRLFMLIGEYMGESAAIGLEDSAKDMEKASAGLVQSAVDGMGDGNYVSKSFLEWYIDQQTDSALLAIENDKDRIDEALTEFNKLPGEIQNDMISRYAKKQTDMLPTGTLRAPTEKEIEEMAPQVKKQQKSMLEIVWDAVWGQTTKQKEPTLKDVAKSTFNIGTMTPILSAIGPVIGGLIGKKSQKNWNKKNLLPWITPIVASTTKGLMQAQEDIREMNARNAVTVADLLFSDKTPKEKDIEEKTLASVLQATAKALPHIMQAMSGLSIPELPLSKELDTLNQMYDNGSLTAIASAVMGISDEEPVITPIVDLTYVQAAADTVSQWFGGSGIELSADGNRYARESVPSGNQTTSEYKAPDNSWIKDSIATLGSQILAMGDQISNMQIVLDSGGLVGAVTDGVNKNLGAKTTYNRRKN